MTHVSGTEGITHSTGWAGGRMPLTLDAYRLLIKGATFASLATTQVRGLGSSDPVTLGYFRSRGEFSEQYCREYLFCV